ncbi:MAG TPA: S49 family peptidase [Anaerolineales bacterium]|nr:S49 family peptidase [Anaerolineales bacterium]
MKVPELKWEQVQRGLLWIALPLLIGILIATAIPKPVIGVIRLEDAIYAATGQDLIAQIDYAMEHPEVRAVVLALDSPGGTVVDTESVYLELAKLRAKKPVVTAVNGMAASGAYYLSSGTDYIFAKPTSEVGNIGVIGYLPPSPFIYEDIISTGPYKLWGSPRDTYLREIEMIKQGFFQAVTLGRGDRLKVGSDVILRGQIWTGTEALRLGIIDQLGTESDAELKAAQMAKVWHYNVIDLAPLAVPNSTLNVSITGFFAKNDQGALLPYPSQPGLYMLFIPPLPTQAQEAQ